MFNTTVLWVNSADTASLVITIDAALAVVLCISGDPSTMIVYCAGYVAGAAAAADCGPPLPHFVPALCPEEWQQGQGREGGAGEGCCGWHERDLDRDKFRLHMTCLEWLPQTLPGNLGIARHCFALAIAVSVISLYIR